MNKKVFCTAEHFCCYSKAQVNNIKLNLYAHDQDPETETLLWCVQMSSVKRAF